MIKFKTPLSDDERDMLLQSLECDLMDVRADLTVLFTATMRLISEVTGKEIAEIADFYLDQRKTLLGEQEQRVRALRKTRRASRAD